MSKDDWFMRIQGTQAHLDEKKQALADCIEQAHNAPCMASVQTVQAFFKYLAKEGDGQARIAAGKLVLLSKAMQSFYYEADWESRIAPSVHRLRDVLKSAERIARGTETAFNELTAQKQEILRGICTEHSVNARMLGVDLKQFTHRMKVLAEAAEAVDAAIGSYRCN